MISSARDTDAATLQPFRPLSTCIVPAIAIIIRGAGRSAASTPTMDTGDCVQSYTAVDDGNRKKENRRGNTEKSQKRKKQIAQMEEEIIIIIDKI